MAKNKKYHELFSGIVCNDDQKRFRDAVMEGFEGYIKCELPISYRGRLAMHIDKL